MDMKIIIGASIGAAIEGFKKLITTGQTVGSKLKTAMSTAMSPLAALTGIGLNIAGVAKVFSLLDDIGKGADRLQVTTKAYQELSYAAGQTGTSIEKMEAAIGKSADLYQKAAAGDAAAMKTLGKIGLKWQDLAGLSPDRIFDQLAEGLNKIEDPLRKFEAAKDIFGEKNAQKLMPLINGLADMRREANDLNFIIADETVRAAERAGDAFDRMGKKMLAGLAKSGVVEWLEQRLKDLDEWLNKTTEKSAAGKGIYTREQAREKVKKEINHDYENNPSFRKEYEETVNRFERGRGIKEKMKTFGNQALYRATFGQSGDWGAGTARNSAYEREIAIRLSKMGFSPEQEILNPTKTERDTEQDKLQKFMNQFKVGSFEPLVPAPEVTTAKPEVTPPASVNVPAPEVTTAKPEVTPPASVNVPAPEITTPDPVTVPAPEVIPPNNSTLNSKLSTLNPAPPSDQSDKSDKSDPSEAIKQLITGAEQALGRSLTAGEMDQLAPKIEEIKQQFAAVGQVRADAAADILKREELATQTLQAQLNEETEKIKLEQIKNELKRRNLELSDDEWKKINAQLEAQGKLNREIKARPAQKQLKDRDDDLDRQLKRQQMILKGQGRDVFIQDEVDKAQKIAKDNKFELTPDQIKNITEKSGKLFDLQQMAEPTRLVGPENKVFTDSLLRIGGQIGNINGQPRNQNYDKIQAEKLTSMESKINMLYDKIPNRTEFGTGGTF